MTTDPIAATAAVAVIVGAISPFLTALATDPRMSAGRKRAISATVAVVLGVITAIVTGTINGVPESVTSWIVRIVVVVAAVITASQGIYKQFEGSVKAVESATSPGADREVVDIEPNPEIVAYGESAWGGEVDDL